MAGGGNDPRQAMINMMYLVLTALLALNVSKDILKSFLLVNNSLDKTVVGFDEKNKETYSEIQLSATENPQKAQEVYEKSVKIRKATDELVNKIDSYKKSIVTKVNPEAESVNDLGDAIDNIDHTAVVMINGEGKNLRKDLEEYKETLKSFIKPDQKVLLESIDINIDTDDPKREGPKTESWESEKFISVPLVAGITLLTKIQSDLRNVESDVIGYLYEQIDAASFKFNKLDPVVITKSNYVPLGSKFDADIFLAAYDTTKPATVYVKSGFKKSQFDKEKFGNQKSSFQKLEIGDDGKAEFIREGRKEGFFQWGGVLEFAPTSKTEPKLLPFEFRYEVAKPSLTVSATKMNVFYIGVDNPVSISVPGASASNLVINPSSNLKIKKLGNGNYVVRASRGNKATISVGVKDGSSVRRIGTNQFRVKLLPDPVPTVNGKKGGLISKSELKVAGGVTPILKNFDFDVKYVITSYEFSFLNQGDILSEKSSNGLYTPKISTYISRLRPKQKVYFENIKARGPDGVTRNIGSISFKIK